MRAAGVCGSDLHVVAGDWEVPTPVVLGHERAGVVTRTGPGVDDRAPWITESPTPPQPITATVAPSGTCAADAPLDAKFHVARRLGAHGGGRGCRSLACSGARGVRCRILGCNYGSVDPQRDIPRLVEMYIDGELDLDALISGRRPLEEAAAALADLASGRALRTLLITAQKED